MPILTIAIPTYNRAPYLGVLLDRLMVDHADELGRSFLVLVRDNASTDGTRELLGKYAGRNGFTYVMNPENIGPDLNVAACFEACRTEYLWILGDDDLPMEGCVLQVVDVIKRIKPSMLYLPARWQPAAPFQGPAHAVADRSVNVGGGYALGLQSHIYITFLSSWVINRAACGSESSLDFHRYLGSNLVQLAWHFQLIEREDHFAWGTRPWIVATAGNSGGYDVLKTFTLEFTRIAEEKLKNCRLRTFYPESMRTLLLPSLLWNIRRGKLGRFEYDEKTISILDDFYQGSALRLKLVGWIMQGKPLCGHLAKVLLGVHARLWLAHQRLSKERTVKLHL